MAGSVFLPSRNGTGPTATFVLVALWLSTMSTVPAVYKSYISLAMESHISFSVTVATTAISPFYDSTYGIAKDTEHLAAVRFQRTL